MNHLINYCQFINESQQNQGKKLCNIFVGRFQPFHLGHLYVAEEMYKENKLPTMIFAVRSVSGKNIIFDDKLTKEMINTVVKNNHKLICAFREISTVAIDKQILSQMRPEYEPVLLGAGEDRSSSYQRQIDIIRDKYHETNIRDDFKVFELKRQGGFIATISATKIREALKQDDEKTYKSMMPKELYSYYNELRSILLNKN